MSGARTSAIIGKVVYRPAYLYAKRPHGLRRKSNSPRPAFLDDTEHAWDLGPNMGLSSILRTAEQRGMGLAGFRNCYPYGA